MSLEDLSSQEEISSFPQWHIGRLRGATRASLRALLSRNVRNLLRPYVERPRSGERISAARRIIGHIYPDTRVENETRKKIYAGSKSNEARSVAWKDADLINKIIKD